jgi:hypothetical protein
LWKQKVNAMKNETTMREKRPYRKKTLLTQDELWKLIIPIVWAPLIQFYLEEWVELIDFTRKPTFLDKEMKRLMPRGKSKNRTVDVLMRVFMKDGTTKKFLFHIEIQGYYDVNFEHRIFQYYYRIDDLLQEPIETLVIMIDEDPDYRPSEYKQSFGQTSVSFKFRLFKLLDNPPPYIGKEDNLFSIVLEVAWYALKRNKLKSDDDLLNLKFHLIRRLMEREIEKPTIYALLDFINIYLPFKNSEINPIFDQEIDSLIEIDNNMEATSIRDLYIQRVKEEERRIAKWEIQRETRRREDAEARREDAEARRKEEESRRKEEESRREKQLVLFVMTLQKQGFIAEKIAETVGESLMTVQNIIDKNA